MVLVREAAPRPPHDHRPEFADVFDQGSADAINVWNLRLRPDPNSVVDDAADMFGELAVKCRTDRGDRLIKQDCD